MKERLPVVTLSGLKCALEAGGVLQVTCEVAPERRSNQYRGEWTFALRGENGQADQQLYVYGRSIKPKVVKTLTGLMSMGMELGVEKLSIPYIEDTQVEWSQPKVPAA